MRGQRVGLRWVRGVFHGWWVVLVAVLAMFAATLTGGSGFSIFVLPMAADLGWDRKTIAGALSLGTIFGAVSAPFFGRLVDRYGARVMLTATGLGLGVSMVPIAWVQTPAVFYALYGSARMLDMGVLNTAATTAVANWFVRLRGRALGLTMAGNAIGVALLTPLAQWISAGWGWRAAWLVLSLTAALLLTPLAWWLVRRRPEDVGLWPDGDAGPPATRVGRRQAGYRPDWTLEAAIRTSAFWLLVAASALTAFSVAGMSLHQVPVLVENGLEPASVAWLISLYGLAWIFGSISWGFVGERLPARFVLAAVQMLIGLCAFALPHISLVGPAILYASLYGLFNGGKETIDALVWADYYGRGSLGAIRGYSRPLIVGANAGGGFVGGLAYDSLGSYVLVVTAFGVLAVAGGLLALLARPPQPVEVS